MMGEVVGRWSDHESKPLRRLVCANNYVAMYESIPAFR